MPIIKQRELPKHMQNIWMDYIFAAKHMNIFEKIMLKYKLNKEFKKVTPDIEYMKSMAQALIYLSAYFLYPNIHNESIIAAHKNKETVTIYLNPNKVTRIEISMRDDNISLSTYNLDKKMLALNWKQSQAEKVICNIYEEELFTRIINLLMDSFKKVLYDYL